jgi:hypothetical protein
MDVNKMKFLSVANKSLVFVLSMSTVFATAAQAVPRPIVPEPALRLHFASHQPKYTVKQLPSGKKMKLHFVGPLIFADGDQALLLSYESDFKLDDMSKLKKEVEFGLTLNRMRRFKGLSMPSSRCAKSRRVRLRRRQE